MINEPDSQIGMSAEVDAALVAWVRDHPNPNAPTISMLGRTYSPRQLLDEVQQATPLGQRFLRFLTRSAQTREVSPEALIYEMNQTNRRFSTNHTRL